ncbi:hypothetical protein [Mesorhizobium waimense]|uniref:hypothetical protein n=1 Tax=Mesorhizobium waimense TaxID=1300307 RepID=UPI001FE1794A|nr:hypothetical protein [Mesorhizobium waimense]
MKKFQRSDDLQWRAATALLNCASDTLAFAAPIRLSACRNADKTLSEQNDKIRHGKPIRELKPLFELAWLLRFQLRRPPATEPFDARTDRFA